MWSVTTARLTAKVAFHWLAPAGWPAQLALAVAVSVTGGIAGITDQPAVSTCLLVVCLHAVGLYGSFALHELGHAVVLARAPEVTGLRLERTIWRISVIPVGRISGRDSFFGALAGPAVCAAMGGILAFACPQALLHPWFLAHAVFLLPVFGDGRVLIAGARAWRREIRTRRHAPSETHS